MNLDDTHSSAEDSVEAEAKRPIHSQKALLKEAVAVRVRIGIG
jgi:hypothetical protein